MNGETIFLMEGALGERLKREYHIPFDGDVAMAGLLYEARGREALRRLWKGYRQAANENGLAFLATTPTRRANRERVARSRFDETLLLDNVRFLQEIRRESEGRMYIGGLMGCKGDAYTGEGALPAEEAAAFHFWQASLFAQAGVDFLFAGIMPTLPEAIGMAQAMERTGKPYIISFMIRRDGRLIDGTFLHDAIAAIDGDVTRKPACYMTNCVHPDILYEALCAPRNQTPLVRARFRGIQANTSPLSPEELDGSAELKCSDAAVLARQIWRLREVMDLKIIGGCCGTDDSHMRQIAADWGCLA